jgi:hypothetical protein
MIKLTNRHLWKVISIHRCLLVKSLKKCWEISINHNKSWQSRLKSLNFKNLDREKKKYNLDRRENPNSLKKLVSTLRTFSISISIGLDCRDPQGYLNACMSVLFVCFSLCLVFMYVFLFVCLSVCAGRSGEVRLGSKVSVCMYVYLCLNLCHSVCLSVSHGGHNPLRSPQLLKHRSFGSALSDKVS